MDGPDSKRILVTDLEPAPLISGILGAQSAIRPELSEILGVIARDVTSGVVWDGHDSALFYFRTSGLARNNNAQLVRLKSDGERSRRALNQLVDQELPGATRFTASMTEALSMQTYPFRATSVIAGFLGRLALVLTLSGLYGVMSYLVTLRTKEIGIGMALGACQSRLRAWRVLTIPPARVQ